MTEPTSDKAGPDWLGQVASFELRETVTSSSSSNSYDDYVAVVRSAFILLESQIRDASGLGEHSFGKILIEDAFHPQRGILQPVSPSAAECEGLFDLLRGIFLYYRNPIAHRPQRYTEASAKPIIFLIDHALSLVAESANSVVPLEKFVGPQEGQILRRRDYRLDIDNDGQKEVVALIQFGRSLVDGSLSHRIAPVILKPADKGYIRIPAESIAGVATHGSMSIVTANITSREFPDICVHRSFGMSSTQSSLLRRTENGYVLTRREIVEGDSEPYFGPESGGFLTHYPQEFCLADFDGDGLVEIIQHLMFNRSVLPSMGYDLGSVDEQLTPVICRVIKWDAAKQLLCRKSEHLVVEESKPCETMT